MSFLNSIQTQSKKYDFPFDHWEYHNALTDGAIEEIVKADIPDVSKHNLSYDGTRAIDGGAAEFRKGLRVTRRCFKRHFQKATRQSPTITSARQSARTSGCL